MTTIEIAMTNDDGVYEVAVTIDNVDFFSVVTESRVVKIFVTHTNGATRWYEYPVGSMIICT